MGDDSSFAEEDDISQAEDVRPALEGLGDFAILTAPHGKVKCADGELTDCSLCFR